MSAEEKTNLPVEKTNVIVNQVFGIPIWATDPYEFSDEEKRHLKKFYNDTIENKDKNKTSTNNYIFKDEILKDIKQFIQDNLDAYWHSLYAVDESVKLRITQSWVNFNEKNTSHHSHCHSNSVISGVMYVENTAPLIVERPLHWSFCPHLSFKHTKENNWNTPQMSIATKNGVLILFPSTTLHRVGPNKSENCRISISFNAFPVGKLGFTERLTELNINE